MPTPNRSETFKLLDPELQKFPNVPVPDKESNHRDVMASLNQGMSETRKEIPVADSVTELPKFLEIENESKFDGLPSKIGFLCKQIRNGVPTNIPERFRKTLEEYKIELLKLVNQPNQPSLNNEKINDRIAEIDKILGLDEYKEAGPIVERLLEHNYTPNTTAQKEKPLIILPTSKLLSSQIPDPWRQTKQN